MGDRGKRELREAKMHRITLELILFPAKVSGKSCIMECYSRITIQRKSHQRKGGTYTNVGRRGENSRVRKHQLPWREREGHTPTRQTRQNKNSEKKKNRRTNIKISFQRTKK